VLNGQFIHLSVFRIEHSMRQLFLFAMMFATVAFSGTIREGTMQARSDGSNVTIQWGSMDESSVKEFVIEREAVPLEISFPLPSSQNKVRILSMSMWTNLLLKPPGRSINTGSKLSMHPAVLNFPMSSPSRITSPV
jgi:hypothetical protein